MEEKSKELYGFDKLKSRFPNIREEDIPESVIEGVGETGDLTLEYLAYENRRLSEINAELLSRAAAADADIGDQRSPDTSDTPLNEEFIRSLWGK